MIAVVAVALAALVDDVVVRAVLVAPAATLGAGIVLLDVMGTTRHLAATARIVAAALVSLCAYALLAVLLTAVGAPVDETTVVLVSGMLLLCTGAWAFVAASAGSLRLSRPSSRGSSQARGWSSRRSRLSA